MGAAMFDDPVYRAQFACVFFALVLLCITLADIFISADLIGLLFEYRAAAWVLWLLLWLAAPYFKRFFDR